MNIARICKGNWPLIRLPKKVEEAIAYLPTEAAMVADVAVARLTTEG